MEKTYLSDQKNKSHKKIRKKLEKKRKQQKDREDKKKEKSWKKQLLIQQKQKHYKGEKQSISLDKLTFLLFEFKENYPEEVDSLITIGQFLDQGQKIDTSTIENSQCKILLENIFTILDLQENNQMFWNENKSIKFEELFGNILKKKLIFDEQQKVTKVEDNQVEESFDEDDQIINDQQSLQIDKGEQQQFISQQPKQKNKIEYFTKEIQRENILKLKFNIKKKDDFLTVNFPQNNIEEIFDKAKLSQKEIKLFKTVQQKNNKEISFVNSFNQCIKSEQDLIYFLNHLKKKKNLIFLNTRRTTFKRHPLISFNSILNLNKIQN